MRRTWLLALLAMPSLTAAPVPKGKKEPMASAVGTVWVFTRGGDGVTATEEVTESEEKDGVRTFTVTVKRSDADGTRFEKYRIQDGTLAVTANSEGEFDPPWVIWKPGLKDGDSWAVKYEYAGATTEGTHTVGTPEEVKTPAGTFTATPVTIRYSGEDAADEVRYWFVEGIGLVKDTEGGKVDQELQNFTPAKEKK